MSQFENAAELMTALRSAPKGSARSALIKDMPNRRLIANSGANVTLYSGQLQSGSTWQQKLSGVYVGLIERLNSPSGDCEGVGALGGLSERISSDEFATLSPDQQAKLIGCKDDVINNHEGQPIHISDLNRISRNTVQREVAEELGNLGIYDFELAKERMKLVDMPDLQDDNFLINSWNGQGSVWIVSPYCYMLEVPETCLDHLQQRSLEVDRHEQNSEAQKYSKLPLFEALGRWHKPHEGCQSNSRNYHYPHEWLACWAIAADKLDHNDINMLRLAAEVQNSLNYPLSFDTAAKMMNKDLDYFSEVLGFKKDTAMQMEQVASNLYQMRTQKLVKSYL